MQPRIFIPVIAAVLMSVLQSFAADWPQWRGPNRDGVWPEDGIIQKFGSEQLPIRWRAKISNGYSGPSVAKGRVYVTDKVSRPNVKERVHCFDAMNGRKIWSYEYECNYDRIGHGDGPRASVSLNNNRAYSLGAAGHLFCFDASSGKVIWSKDLDTEYDIQKLHWGIAPSPLVEKDLVIVLIGGRDNACVVAFDKETGRERWRALGDQASYSAPIIIEQAGKQVLVCLTGKRVVGLDPLTGKLYWEYPFPPARMIHNIATPVFHNNYMFFSGFFDGSLLLKLCPEMLVVEKVWQRRGPSEKKTESLHCNISTPILQGDYIYGVDSYGELRCLDLYTGDRIWESLDAVPQGRWSNIHLIRNQDRVWMFNERGELIISKLSPKGFHEISRAKLIKPTEGQLDQRGGVCWTHPAFADKHVYVRNDEELVCADLSARD